MNHRSIEWDDRAQKVAIYHIELAAHAVLIAHGAPAESYRNDGNRRLFQNGNSGWHLPPQQPCAPVLTGGARVDAIWRHLLDRAGRPCGLPVTQEPDLHLRVDGVRIDGRWRADGSLAFALPPHPGEVRVVSRAGVPAELGLARDDRTLGVAVHRVTFWRGSSVRLIEASDPSLAEGFHPFEADNAFRWTDGDARLPTGLFADLNGPGELVLHIGGTTTYSAFDAPTQAAA